ncbi:hypothetical protein I553_1090 [Mycobacterium xenopi 4042]|uniref:Uncharacterized protein n=1 Tax=Mycobacterium xenopi 4042 TaxID=1299334 RepID=X7ZBZ8_MYCXE|nr:hypothetical protein I553_1090 [Mycobacterium xenopi 4042]
MALGLLVVHLADKDAVHVDGALVQARPTHSCNSGSKAL